MCECYMPPCPQSLTCSRSIIAWLLCLETERIILKLVRQTAGHLKFQGNYFSADQRTQRDKGTYNA